MGAFIKRLFNAAVDKVLIEGVNWKALALKAGAALLALWVVIATFLRGHYVVYGWFLALLTVGSVAFCLAAVIWGTRVWRASRKYRPLLARDQQMGIGWRIEIDPKEWPTEPISSLVARDYLSGPYHLRGECHAEMRFQHVPGQGGVRMFCPVCSTTDQWDYRFDAPGTREQMRSSAFAELQRLRRAGRWSGGDVLLENPEYWKLYFPQSGVSGG